MVAELFRVISKQLPRCLGRYYLQIAMDNKLLFAQVSWRRFCPSLRRHSRMYRCSRRGILDMELKTRRWRRSFCHADADTAEMLCGRLLGLLHASSSIDQPPAIRSYLHSQHATCSVPATLDISYLDRHRSPMCRPPGCHEPLASYIKLCLVSLSHPVTICNSI